MQNVKQKLQPLTPPPPVCLLTFKADPLPILNNLLCSRHIYINQEEACSPLPEIVERKRSKNGQLTTVLHFFSFFQQTIVLNYGHHCHGRIYV